MSQDHLFHLTMSTVIKDVSIVNSILDALKKSNQSTPTMFIQIKDYCHTMLSVIPGDTALLRLISGKLTPDAFVRVCKTVASQGVDVRFTYKCRLASVIIERYPDFPSEEVIRIVDVIEQSCYSYTHTEIMNYPSNSNCKWNNSIFASIYSCKMSSIISLFSLTSVTQEDYKIDTNRILSMDLTQLAYMSDIDLCPESTEEERRIIELRQSQTIQRKTSILYQCPKCHIRKCTYVQQQLRSLDEPATYICTCVNCGTTFVGK